MSQPRWLHSLVLLSLLSLTACSDDEGTEADRLGVGAQCAQDEDCAQRDGFVVKCLEFKGGYCGIAACDGDEDCPNASACVAHDDGEQYCFRTCIDKVECNANRDADVESNCSANITFVNGDRKDKACVPPS